METSVTTQEQWRDVIGYENLYQVSDYGRVKSLARKTNNQYCKNEVILSPSDDTYGYNQVVLCTRQNAKRIKRAFKVHRLVAMAFIPNNEGKPLINHKDWDRKNNHISNLEWVTSKENLNHKKPKNGYGKES